MEIELIIEKVITSLKTIKGIEAIVLGGSRAKGNYSAKSDIDIGIYYSNDSELDLMELKRVATELDDTHRTNLITRIGEWGPWINGGGWLCIDGVATDFLFRNINKVATVIDDCLNKKITIDYQPGHPHGFVNTIYIAETYYCKILWDTNNLLVNLKDKITPYPLPIKTGIVDKFLWEAGFSNSIAYKGLLKNDIVYTTGCIYRVISCLMQVIYALNETYIMNEKGSLANIDTFKIIPEAFKEKVENIFLSLTSDTKNMKNILDELSGVIKEVERLCSKYVQS
jgi:predicted nucleotidyltransferase